MSKRRTAQRKPENQPHKKEQKKAIVPVAKGWNSMTNWLVVLVFVLPILFSRETLDPTITLRYIFLSSFVILFILFFYLRKKINFVLTPGIKIAFAFGTAFGLWSTCSLFYAINPSAGYYETARHFLNIILLFIVFVTIQKEESQLLKICQAILLMSVVQSFVGILQFYDLAFSDLPGANEKPFGLMANRNLFGSAQALVIPFLIFVLYRAKKGWKYAAGIALTGIIISIVISQTRSAWLASVSIMLSSLIMIIIFSIPNTKKWVIGMAVSTIIITGLVSLLLIADRENTLAESVKERAATFTQQGGQSAITENVNERIKIWKKTISLIKDKPVTGAGAGNWKLTIPAYGTEGLIWEYAAYVPDRPHNVYLQILSETGIPGGILYLGFWITIAVIAFKVIVNKSQPEDRRIVNVLMLSGLIAFAVDAMFSFPSERIEHSLYIFLMAGIILGTYPGTKENELQKQPVNKILLYIFLLIAAFNTFLGYKKYKFEKHFNYAKAYENNKNYQDELTEVEAGKNSLVTVDPEGKPIEIRSSIAYKELKDYNNALIEINKAKKYNPNSAMIYNNTGIIYTEMGDYNKAIENYLKALELAPKMDIALKNLAVNYFNTGNYQGTIETLNKIKKNDPDSVYLNGLLNDAKRRLSSQQNN